MNSGAKAAIGALVLLVASTCVYYYANAGYGEVSPRAYDYAHALYAACLAKSELRVSRVVELMDAEVAPADGSPSLSPKERQWLDAIVGLAADQKWQSAAKHARRILVDQVEQFER